MMCPRCDENGRQVDMELETWVKDFHDPGDYYGHGQQTGFVWVCETCDYEIECDDHSHDEDAED